MSTPSIDYVFLALNLVARLARLLYSVLEDEPSGFRLEWLRIERYVRVAFRIVSCLTGVLIVLFAAISLRQPLDILIYITIAYESSLETLQAYGMVRSLASSTKWRIGEAVTFIAIFVLPSSLCFSPALPIPDRYDFFYFAVPVVVNFCGQVVFALMLIPNMKLGPELQLKLELDSELKLELKMKMKLIRTYNVSRAAFFITLSSIVAGMRAAVIITPRQQHTITAIFLAVVAVAPTAFAAFTARSAFGKLLGSSGIPGGQFLSLCSGSERNLALDGDYSKLGQGSSRVEYMLSSEPGRTEASEDTTEPPRSPILPDPWTPDLQHHHLDISHQLPTDPGLPDNRNTSVSVCVSVGGSSTRTESLRSSVLDFPIENGRRYHKYKEGNYFAPNDKREQARMDNQSFAMFLASGKKLFYAPIERPQHVLDLGTGTGQWTLMMGIAYPGASTIGVDLSPIQPVMVFQNNKFEIDDVEENWTWYENHFDLIYSGLMLSGSIADVPKYIQQAFRHCKPGGFFEVHELQMKVSSDHVVVSDDAAMRQWYKYMCDGISMLAEGGRNLDIGLESVISMMRAAGFINVRYHNFKIPLGSWAKDPVLKEAGRYQLCAMLDGIDGLTLAPLTRGLGWKREEVEVLLAQARNDAQSEIPYHLPGYVIWGRKPVQV